MTKDHLIGRLLREIHTVGIANKSINADDLATCADACTKISIEYAIGVLEELGDRLMNMFMDKSARELDFKINQLKSQIV